MIPVRLAAIVGDNLGVHERLGLSRGFTCDCFTCRLCLRSIILEPIRPLLASSETDDVDSADVDRNPTACVFDYTELVNRLGPEKLQSFIKAAFCFENVGRSTMANIAPLDPMHDFGEGVVNYFLQGIITAAVKLGVYSEKELYTTIGTFPFLNGAIELSEVHSGNMADKVRECVDHCFVLQDKEKPSVRKSAFPEVKSEVQLSFKQAKTAKKRNSFIAAQQSAMNCLNISILRKFISSVIIHPLLSTLVRMDYILL